MISSPWGSFRLRTSSCLLLVLGPNCLLLQRMQLYAGDTYHMVVFSRTNVHIDLLRTGHEWTIYPGGRVFVFRLLLGVHSIPSTRSHGWLLRHYRVTRLMMENWWVGSWISVPQRGKGPNFNPNHQFFGFQLLGFLRGVSVCFFLQTEEYLNGGSSNTSFNRDTYEVTN